MENQIGFKNDGSIAIGDVLFRLVEPNDPEVITKSEKCVGLQNAKFDVYNSSQSNSGFFGYLDISFNGMGGWCFVDWKKDKDDRSYIRIDNPPMEAMFGNACENRKDMILAIANHVRTRHEENLEMDMYKWKPVDTELRKRT